MTPPPSQIQSQQDSANQKDVAASAIASLETQANPERSGQNDIDLKKTKQALKAEKRQAKKQAKQQRGSKFKTLKAKFGKQEKEPKTKETPQDLAPSTADIQKAAKKQLAKTPKAQAKKAQTKKVKADSPPATSLNASSLVWGWFKAYPGLWLSPLALGLLGGWVIAQPDPNPTVQEAAAGSSTALESEPQLPPFVSREANPLGPVSPFGETEAAPADAEILADPPDAAALAKETLKKQALEKASQDQTTETESQQQAQSGIASALPGVPTAAPQSAATGAAVSLVNPPAEEQVSSADQAQAAADAKFVLEERAKAQAAAFAQAKANQAASSTPPQPAPPVQGNPAVDQLITMQVAIAEGDTTLSMGGSSQGVLMTQAGEPLLQLEAGDYSMQCDGTGLLLNGQKLPATVMMAPLGGGLNYVRDRSYRGQIQFICQGTTVLAVNHIDMLNYLYSVVGSEVSASWPEAALKAQSVAARSYALTYYFRPAKEHFHIGDTESYQVYKGTVSEDDRVKAAVQATAGEFISYQGGIVESLYAASDDIVMEAFQGGGMSQLGALDFAEQGYNYLQILGYYYPQTSLGRMVIEDGA